MSTKLQEFIERYRDGFKAYLSNRDELALTNAYELGRSAVAQELSVLDLASAHQSALLDSFRSGSDSTSQEDVVRAAGDFFLEGLSAFEVARRALQDARETALVERRHATILRHLSTFLGDASLALDASESLQEMLQLVAEQARELVSAERCTVSVTLDDDTPTIGAFAADQHDPGRDPPLNEASSLSAALTTLDGRQLGLIQAFAKQTGDFSELDEAILVQLAQMASAAVERAQLYRRIQR